MTNMQKVQILKQVDDNWEIVVDCTAQFNPEKLQFSKKASWKTEKTWKSNIGNTTFTGGDPISLSVSLFFDTTATGGDVRDYTEPLMALTMVDLAEAAQVASEEEVKAELEARQQDLDNVNETIASMEEAGIPVPPPILSQKASLEAQIADLEAQTKGLVAGGLGAPPKCKFMWGSLSFIAIMESVNVTFDMFLPDGTPVRATAKLKLKQIEEQSLYPPQNPTTRSAPRKVWVVQEGQTLDWIAYREYGDPSLWRLIATANNLDNPLALRPGQVLSL